MVYLSAADLVMILRVYAMWSRSKRILCLLLPIYIAEIFVMFVVEGIYYNDPNTHLSVTIVQADGLDICNVSFKEVPSKLAVYCILPRLFLSSALLVLAVFQTLKQSVDMHRATKKWQINKYMQLLMRDGIVYFFVCTAYNIYDMFQTGPTINNTPGLYMNAVYSVFLYTAVPRFIISIRELYDHDVHCRWQGINTGFGVLSQCITNDDAAPAITFASFLENDANESDAIRLEVLRGVEDEHQV